MSKLLISLTNIGCPGPYDQVQLQGNVWAEDQGPASPYGWTAYEAISSSQNDLKAAAISAAESVATAHSLTYSGSVLVGWPDEAGADDDSGDMAVPGTSSTVSLSSGTARQPNTTRPVLVMISGSWSWNLSAIGTQTGSLTLKSDSASTPTTVIRAPAWSRGISVGLSIGDTGTVPIEMDLIVKPGDYYSVTAAGGATFTIREQVL